jgi:hypothetical protein
MRCNRDKPPEMEMPATEVAASATGNIEDLQFLQGQSSTLTTGQATTNSLSKSKQYRRHSRRSHRKTPNGRALFSIERLLARAIALAALGQDYSGEIALARAVARAEERRLS